MARSLLITKSSTIAGYYNWAEIQIDTAGVVQSFVDAISEKIDSYFIVNQDNWEDYFATEPIFLKILDYELVVNPDPLVIAANLVIYNDDRFGGIRSAELL